MTHNGSTGVSAIRIFFNLNDVNRWQPLNTLACMNKELCRRQTMADVLRYRGAAAVRSTRPLITGGLLVQAKTKKKKKIKVSCPVWEKCSDAAVTFRQQLLRLSPRCPCTRTVVSGTGARVQVQCAYRNISHYRVLWNIRQAVPLKLDLVVLQFCKLAFTASLFSFHDEPGLKSSVRTYLQLTKSS